MVILATLCARSKKEPFDYSIVRELLYWNKPSFSCHIVTKRGTL